MAHWTRWQPFPDPRKGGLLVAPFGPGVYDLRNIRTGERVLAGSGGNCAYRMCSLLPEPFGCGTRNNRAKREYVLSHIDQVQYRCLACGTKCEGEYIEKELCAKDRYLFPM